jgi:hypothetical protein
MSGNVIPFGHQSPSPENQPSPATASWTKRRRMLRELIAKSAVTPEDIDQLVFSQDHQLPSNGLPFEKAILYVTGVANGNVKAAYARFCAYHVDIYRWDPSQHPIGPGAPGLHWRFGDLVTHRTTFALWRVKKAQASHQRTAENLRKSSKRRKNI